MELLEDSRGAEGGPNLEEVCKLLISTVSQQNALIHDMQRRLDEKGESEEGHGKQRTRQENANGDGDGDGDGDDDGAPRRGALPSTDATSSALARATAMLDPPDGESV